MSMTKDDMDKVNEGKLGNYNNPDNGCPNCARHRVMIGDDGKHRCEKCCWCIEDGKIDDSLSDYMR